jgi:hypothetical protein
MNTPIRTQRKRSKGWILPPNTVCVTRPSQWGNPFSVAPLQAVGTMVGPSYIAVPTIEDAVECYRYWLELNEHGKEIAALAKTELRGKNLACWCKVGELCHADVLLEVANS